MEVVWVALITAFAAVVPQTLTWWQNKQRDAWEKKRHADDLAREERLAAARAKSERDALEREALVKFVAAASTFTTASGIASADEYHPGSKTTQAAINAYAPLLTAASETAIVLDSIGSERSETVRRMLGYLMTDAALEAGAVSYVAGHVSAALTALWPYVKPNAAGNPTTS